MVRIARVLVFAFVVLAVPGVARSDVFSFYAVLSGPAESPPNASPGSGFATGVFDTSAHTLQLAVVFSGLTGTTTASHIHAATAVPGTGTAGVATQLPSFAGFPLGVTSGSFSNTYDMTLASSFSPNFVTNNGGTPASAEAALFTAAVGGRAYLNIHSSTFGGGEIRGFLQAVPEPGVLPLACLVALGAAGTALFRRRAA